MPPEWVPYVPVFAPLVAAIAAAILAALGTFFVQGRLEQQRLRNALATEITRAHIEALKRVFAAVYQLDEAADRFYERLTTNQSIEAVGREFGERLVELRRIVAEERFPLGPRIFEVARDLVPAYEHYIDDLYGNEKYPDADSKLFALKQELHALAPDLDLVPASLLAKLTPKKSQSSTQALARGKPKKQDS